MAANEVKKDIEEMLAKTNVVDVEVEGEMKKSFKIGRAHV